MFIPNKQTQNGVQFERNGTIAVFLLNDNGDCKRYSENPNYTYECLPEWKFSLTIPAENMTEVEQGSEWQCIYAFDGDYKSPKIILNISSKIYFLSM